MTEVFLFAGPKHSGKTTALLRWASSRPGVAGFLTPVADGQRYFQDPVTGGKFAMEAFGDEPFLAVGRYRFSVAAFARAEQILWKAVESGAKWLVIDEVGPLELRGEGFAPLVRDLLTRLPEGTKLVLVVREELVGAVCAYFGIQGRNFQLPPSLDTKPD